MSRRLLALLCCALLAGCVRVNVHGDPGQAMTPDHTLRVATYNASLYSDEAGGLLRRLESGDTNARKVAAVLQRVRPDVVLVNEFDHDPTGRAADAFQRDYLEVPQAGGGAALRYPYRYFAPVNTGVPSGLDLDRSGHVAASGPVEGEDAAGARARGNDAWGYGLHPGQYGMLLLSMHPIDAAAARTFQRLPWAAMPGAARPVDPATGAPWHDDATWSKLRLSSKSHWDVPVRTPLGTVHVLASHPTPPVFDGPEDRNGARNHDEIRLWTEYVGAGDLSWLCDDAGRCGGLGADARFVVLGDLNNDPADGDGRHQAIVDLLEHPRVLRSATPRSEGAAHAEGAHRPGRRGDVAHATGDFGPRVGPLRLDYALPSTGFRLLDAGVYWPAPGADGADIVDGTDHRLVWVDLAD
ncbi:endonuclease/exonuclease/phosphatase family protein [Luteimonas sp. Sa2BVA3]|uniref:Endonuclease/exonuclease/phosphatase family protein n=1 Tax=Luteimonas colneyensis TaxID=2762230 RepID=A0ABR8UKW0_9GAMM|nr:endonuclease/exonuclease/phosphatase family protein [Luteimonas colneyensis]MBD7988662.1 endonuclease/exonuclease/phosphatase family protein [Luteimonas colneyensis]